MYRKLIFALFSQSLAACTSIPLTSIPKLARINFMTTDIPQIRIAITAPPQLGLMKPPGYFTYKYQIGGEAEHEDKIALEETFDPVERANVPDDIPPGSSLHVFRMPSASADQLQKLRDDEKQRATNGKKHGSLTIGIVGNFCKKSELPVGPILSTDFVLTSETQGWVTFTRNYDLRSTKTGQDELAKIESCS